MAEQHEKNHAEDVGRPDLGQGKKKPVTLVRMVNTRNTAVHPGSRLAPSMPAIR